MAFLSSPVYLGNFQKSKLSLVKSLNTIKSTDIVIFVENC